MIDFLRESDWSWQAVHRWSILYTLLYSLVLFLAGVAFLCWLFRARANAYAISPGVSHTYPAAFMVLGWSIPLVNLFVPKGIVDDIRATSRPGGLPPGSDLLRIRPSGQVRAWWLTWLAWWGAEITSTAVADTDAKALKTALLVADIVLAFAAALLAARVVMTITGLQEAARARARSGSAPPLGEPAPPGADDPVSYLGLVSLVVRDYDEAIAFYVGSLGLELLEDRLQDDGSRWVTVRPRGARETAVLLARAVTPVQEARVGDQVGGRVGLFLHTDDFVRDYGRMKAAGVAFEELPRQEFYGTVAAFQDLYGNRWNLLQSNASAVPG
ncbi:catechol 2,3-dioxygenase-like lactoylglutathione lyase family enzyme [Streptosporangium becharense]|uniref:Catechol 2,3-dioxygenase-like lactoylglutathione lyase family enzyme n=1 Tax=Streptosporangium becharense TaxID=1816182 RepID=A0A7W9MH74_9ACTN|nr:DUF4328 domain-containing protein [Streptosporangium becharense]MBB2914933.1 catechol 2,3-dioxygenase-like lactoylglutathione lyase family enzyme [Streptosporangium becharense]MBB5820256.1 catechol 2,3-dioxygenase-like lactoylglutathione lyase family enzyme [Streptosporangium becharense]